jgi:hypothetical protein
MEIFNSSNLEFNFSYPHNFEHHNYIWDDEKDKLFILDSSLN